MPTTDPPRPWLRIALVCGVLFGGTLLLYWRATGFDFLNYDDPEYLTQNPHVQAGLTRDGLVWAFTAPTDYWHPLTWLSHMADWQLYGSAAFGHHLTSIVWHAVNAVLAFLVFQRIAGGFWRYAFAAALFAWHPLRVESVVWVTERKDVMSGCFFLLTLLAYGGYVQARAAGARAWPRYLLCLGCFVAGLMSKPMVVTLPLVLLILDVWPHRRCTSLRSLGAVVLEKLPFFALSAAAALATILLQQHVGAFVLDVAFSDRVGNAVVSLARYLGKFVWPFDLVICYPHPGRWPVAVIAAAAAVALGLGVLAWRQRQPRPWIAAGLAWFVVTLLPVLGLVQVGFQSIADRYTYLPLLGIELALIWSVPAWTTAVARWITATVAVVALAGSAWRNADQQSVWRDSVTLFEHAVRVSDRNDVAHDFLASALFAAGRYDEAGAHAEKATALNPRNSMARVTLAGVREQQGRLLAAIDLYRSALALRPDNPIVQCQLGLLELTLGERDEAWRRMEPALRASPALRQTTLQNAHMALQKGNWPVARTLHELVLAVAPDDANAHVGLGFVLIRTGDRAAGLAHWRRALELDPNYPQLREQLAAAER